MVDAYKRSSHQSDCEKRALVIACSCGADRLNDYIERLEVILETACEVLNVVVPSRPPGGNYLALTNLRHAIEECLDFDYEGH